MSPASKIARFNLRVFLCALCVLCGDSPARAELPRDIRIVTYNIHHGEGTDGEIDLERIAKVIAAESPHLVAVNEVDQGTARTRRLDMPAELGRLTKMQALFYKNIDFEGGRYGNAVLSRLPIKRSENHKLPSHYAGEQRGVLEVQIDGGADGDVYFFATHLDYRPNDGERLASVARIEQIVGERRDRPIILAGDLNASPDSAVMAAFAEHWTRANEQVLPTFPAAKPENQIDYILMRPAVRWKVVETRVLEESVASDHRGLLAVLRRQESN